MRASNNSSTNQITGYGQLISLHDDKWLERQRVAGKVAAGAIDLLVGLVKDKADLSLIEMNALAEDYITSNGCIPTFKGYSGHSVAPFPTGCCISVNKALVHGIPTDYKLQEGDLVSFDLGTTFEGAIADTATTVIYGKGSEEHQRLIEDTKIALDLAIQSISVGKRIGVIGNAIYKYGSSKGYSVVDKYGGHGITYNRAHYFPFVSNKANPSDSVVIHPGMVIAIEPLFVLGSSNNTAVSEDGWTVMCEEICAHFEHSLYIHEDKVEVITARQGE